MTPNQQLGRFFEDFCIGEIFRNPIGRTITQADNTWFTLLTMNSNQSHFNEHYALSTEFERPIVNSGLTVAIVLGLSVIDISQHAIANLGWEEIRLTRPVFAGDTLYSESRIIDLRPSKSRPHAGIVTVRTRGLNQDGEVCLSWRRTVLVCRGTALQAQGSFPEPVSAIEDEDRKPHCSSLAPSSGEE